jgi:hypothetical protein
MRIMVPMKVRKVIDVVRFTAFWSTGMDILIPLSNRIIARVTPDKTGPNNPRSDGSIIPKIGPIRIPMPIKKIRSGILVRANRLFRYRPKRIRTPRKSTESGSE